MDLRQLRYFVTIVESGSLAKASRQLFIAQPALSQQIDAHELAGVVDRFETIAYDTVNRLGGRVVKMIGDEVMFSVPDEASAVEIALSLSETYRDDDELHFMDSADFTQFAFRADDLADQIPYMTENMEGVEALVVDDGNAYLSAGLAGIGALWLPAYMARTYVERGELVPLFADWQLDPMPMSIAFPPNRHVSAKLRVFIDWIVALMAQQATVPSARLKTNTASVY